MVEVKSIFKCSKIDSFMGKKKENKILGNRL